MANDVHVVWDENAVKLFAEDPHGAVARAMDQLADGVVFSQKFRCPVSPVGSEHRSGELRSSIQKFWQPDGSYLVGPTKMVGPPWGPPRFLGPLLEYGTRPHEIRSHGNYPLRNRETGDVFGQRVWHPGTRPQPFVEPSVHDLAGVIIHLH